MRERLGAIPQQVVEAMRALVGDSQENQSAAAVQQTAPAPASPATPLQQPPAPPVGPSQPAPSAPIQTPSPAGWPSGSTLSPGIAKMVSGWPATPPTPPAYRPTKTGSPRSIPAWSGGAAQPTASGGASSTGAPQGGLKATLDDLIDAIKALTDELKKTPRARNRKSTPHPYQDYVDMVDAANAEKDAAGAARMKTATAAARIGGRLTGTSSFVETALGLARIAGML